MLRCGALRLPQCLHFWPWTRIYETSIMLWYIKMRKLGATWFHRPVRFQCIVLWTRRLWSMAGGRGTLWRVAVVVVITTDEHNWLTMYLILWLLIITLQFIFFHFSICWMDWYDTGNKWHNFNFNSNKKWYFTG